MKIYAKKTIHKIIIAISLVVSVNFLIPQYSYCTSWGDIGGSLLKEVTQLIVSFGDGIMGLLNYFMLGTDGMGSAMLSQAQAEANAETEGSALYVDDSAPVTTEIEDGYMDVKGLLDLSEFQIPNLLYSPDNIFANNIAALDINFLRENSYESAILRSQNEKIEQNAEKKSQSAAGRLRDTIATWYKSFRNIAIVGLLSVLVYLGIRILISTAASDKAKYKESIQNWLVALVLVFIIHIIMSGILMISEQVTKLFGSSINDGIVVSCQNYKWPVSDTSMKFKTNLIGLARFKAQAQNWQDAVGYSLVYTVLVVFTVMFTFMYFKRFLYMAFFTMIAPLVALTYPIDKAGDSKAQAFNMWFKEYTMNVILQPIHLIIYVALVSSSIDLATDNMIYALVAIGFMIPAEKIIKKMFGFDKAETTTGFGTFAAGAVTMGGIQALANRANRKDGGRDKALNNGKADDSDSWKVAPPRFNGFSNQQISDGDDGNSSRQQSVQTQSRQQQEEDDEEESSEGEVNSRELSNDEQQSIQTQSRQQQEVDDEKDTSKDEINSAKLNNNEQTLNNGNDDYEEISANPIPTDNREKNDRKSHLLDKNVRWQNTKFRAGNMAKKVLKNGAKAGVTGTFMLAGGIGGVVAATASGNFGNLSKYMGTGLIAGKTVANRVNKIPQNARNSVDDFTRGMDDRAYDKYDYAYARQMEINRRDERNKKNYLKDEKQIQKARMLRSKLGTNASIDEIMEARYDYQKNGVHDDRVIDNGISASYKADGKIKGNKHKDMVDIASYAASEQFNGSNIREEKKRAQMEKKLSTESGLKGKPKALEQKMLDFSTLYGDQEYWKQNSTAGFNSYKKPKTKATSEDKK